MPYRRTQPPKDDGVAGLYGEEGSGARTPSRDAGRPDLAPWARREDFTEEEAITRRLAKLTAALDDPWEAAVVLFGEPGRAGRAERPVTPKAPSDPEPPRRVTRRPRLIRLGRRRRGSVPRRMNKAGSGGH